MCEKLNIIKSEVLLIDSYFYVIKLCNPKILINEMILTIKIIMFPLLSLEDFEILGRVGSGTYGSVYKAVMKSTQETVALKKVNYFSNIPGIPFEFIRELKAMYSIKNKNLVQLKGIIANEKTQEIYTVLNYYRYDLNELIHGGFLHHADRNDIQTIFSQVASGLYAIHSEGFMHRDIKPSNILINANGEIFLSDFGLCRKKTQNTRYSQNVVALPYRAPEIFSGIYDEKVDIWALGCLLFELCTCEILFTPKPTDIEMAKEIAKACKVPIECIIKPKDGQQEINANVNECTIERIKCPECSECLDLLSKMLVINPEKRISIADIMKHPFVANAHDTTLELSDDEYSDHN